MSILLAIVAMLILVSPSKQDGCYINSMIVNSLQDKKSSGNTKCYRMRILANWNRPMYWKECKDICKPLDKDEYDVAEAIGFHLYVQDGGYVDMDSIKSEDGFDIIFDDDDGYKVICRGEYVVRKGERSKGYLEYCVKKDDDDFNDSDFVWFPDVATKKFSYKQGDPYRTSIATPSCDVFDDQ